MNSSQTPDTKTAQRWGRSQRAWGTSKLFLNKKDFKKCLKLNDTENTLSLRVSIRAIQRGKFIS